MGCWGESGTAETLSPGIEPTHEVVRSSVRWQGNDRRGDVGGGIGFVVVRRVAGRRADGIQTRPGMAVLDWWQPDLSDVVQLLLTRLRGGPSCLQAKPSET